ncbi:acyl transferase/acyl hydrolase/lysophospholipase [Macrophomina phaseolina]|uniref:Acyl transferase/acyl hydrolase/lysophospholipase n=1 Tax=Macrophomina phaseolina TaxID=35725 RepID=A0ABQ8GLQ5_9PEZI|nr:acyl transferase/acyl hydrolase/lysophospholipase [Macrophomina phaseolina]
MAALKVDTGTPRRPRSVRTVRTFASADDDYSNGSEWARTVKNPWDPAILTLDGGGIRGYSSLLMVQQLMHEIAEWERKLEMEEAAEAATRRKDGTSTPPMEPRTFNEDELLPCHYFDFMYGTSTGGLIATMLGRLRMSVPQCLELYRQVGDNLFGKRRSVLPLTTKYHHKPLESAVKEIVRRHCKTHPNGTCGGDDWYPWNVEEEEDPVSSLVLRPGEQICQSICLTATHNERVNEAHLLRTYDHRYVSVPNYITLYNEGADKLKIWEVTRATSAAPFYFKILEADIRGEIMGFKDGGIRENNPAGAAWSEFVSLYGEHRDPALVLSIGTGRPDESADGFASAWPGPFGTSRAMKKVAEKFAVFKNVLIKYTEGEEQHRAMVRIAKGENTWYKRLNVDKGLEKMKLDNWEKGSWAGEGHFASSTVPGGRTLTRMEDATAAYLNRPFDHRYDTYAPPMTKVKQAAEKLVRQRRARERAAAFAEEGDRNRDRRRWDTYTGRWLTGEYTDEEDGVVAWERPGEGGERRPSLRNLVSVVGGMGGSRPSRDGRRRGSSAGGGGERRRSSSGGGGGAKASGEQLANGSTSGR